MTAPTPDALRMALNAIAELSFQLSGYPDGDTHPNVSAINDWAKKGLDALASPPVAGETPQASDHRPSTVGSARFDGVRGLPSGDEPGRMPETDAELLQALADLDDADEQCQRRIALITRDLNEAIKARIAAEARHAPTPTCVWTEDDDGIWHTGCGHAFFFDTDGPTENQQKFCGYCGKTLEPKPSEVTP